MESKLAKDAERALIEATQRLTPEERLNAFLTHCPLMMELREAASNRDRMEIPRGQPPSRPLQQ
jgi:hypothetical protein